MATAEAQILIFVTLNTATAFRRIVACVKLQGAAIYDRRFFWSAVSNRRSWRAYFATGALAQPSVASVNSRAAKHQTTTFFFARYPGSLRLRR